MREIKFHGKDTISGKWIYGDRIWGELFRLISGEEVNTGNIYIGDSANGLIRVEPETVKELLWKD